jgi:hypothetical protein
MRIRQTNATGFGFHQFANIRAFRVKPSLSVFIRVNPWFKPPQKIKNYQTNPFRNSQFSPQTLAIPPFQTLHPDENEPILCRSTALTLGVRRAL